jgi:hypothetical protein
MKTTATEKLAPGISLHPTYSQLLQPEYAGGQATLLNLKRLNLENHSRSKNVVFYTSNLGPRTE